MAVFQNASEAGLVSELGDSIMIAELTLQDIAKKSRSLSHRQGRRTLISLDVWLIPLMWSQMM